jgi:hypothetical protein
MPLQEERQQTQSNPAAGTSLLSTAATSTAARDLNTVGTSAVQQQSQQEQCSTFCQPPRYIAQGAADRQTEPVCVYLYHLLSVFVQ